MDSKIVVISFEGQYTADGLMGAFENMEKEGLIKLDDMVVASHGTGPHIDIKQTRSATGRGAKIGAGAGILAGLLLGGPIGGAAVGAAIGAISGKMKDYGIDDKFIKEVSNGLGYNTSAIFLLIKEAKGEEVLERLKPYKGNVLSTTLAPEAQARLEQALSKEEF